MKPQQLYAGTQKSFIQLATRLLFTSGMMLSSIFASAIEIEGINYQLNEGDHTAAVIENTPRYWADVIIPANVTYNEVEYTVTEISKGAFSGCNGLTSIAIPETVTTIGEWAFRDCEGLQKADFASIETFCKIEFPDMYANPLYYTRHLYISGNEVTSIVIPDNITKISAYAFYNFRALTAIEIPNSVTEIGDYAFRGCSGLTSISIPDAVTEIGIHTFFSCKNLTTLKLPDSLVSIGPSAFRACESLTSIEFPKTLSSIAATAFRDCKSLTSIKLPASITEIGSQAFTGCNGLTSVYYDSEDPVGAYYNVFDDGVYTTAPLYVPAEAVEKCKNLQPWKFFANIEAYDFTTDLENVNVDIDNNVPCEVFSLQGAKLSDSIDALVPGIYIIRQGKVVKKIAVK